MLQHYLKIAFRNLWKYKTQSIINILGLSIGFAAFFFATYWHQWEHSFDTFHPEWEKTYAITTAGLFKTSAGEIAELNQLHKDDAEILTSFPEVNKICKIQQDWGLVKMVNNDEIRFTAYIVDSTFFSLFRTSFIEGNIHKIPFNNEHVVLSCKMALRLFGTTQCVGEVISIISTGQFKVSGVIADYPGNTELLFDMLLLTSDNMSNNRRRSTCFVQVHKKEDAITLKEKIESHKSVAEDPYGIDQPQHWQFHLRSLPDVHFACNHSLSERYRNINILYWTGLLLLICVLMNNLVLFIGQQQYKLKNNITYFSFGANSASIASKYILLLLIPVFIAFLLSLVFIESLFPLFDKFTTIRHEGVMIDYTNGMNLDSLLIRSSLNIGICILFYLLISLAPIFYFINQSKTKSGKYSFTFLRRLLIIGQIFIGSLFFITSLCLYKQLHFIKNKPKGITIENVLQVYLGYNTSFQIDMETVKDKLLQLSEVEDVTLTVDPLLLSNGMFNNLGILGIDGRDKEKMREEMELDNFFYIQDNFFRFFNIQFKEGGAFHTEGQGQYIINETGAKNIGFGDLLQRTANSSSQINGIIQDYHYSPLRYPIQTVVFSLLDEHHKKHDTYKYIYIKASPDHFSRIKDAIAEFDRGEVNEEQKYAWLTDIEKEFNRPEETIFFIFSVFAFLCILISSFGIYSLVALTAEQRTKEIAIRKINGAMFKDILALFLKEYFVLVIISNLTALPLGYVFINYWLESYTYHTTISFALFGVVFLITCGIVIFSVAKQVMQASQTNPADVIKSE